MHWSWPGARDRCTFRVPKSPKKPRPLVFVHATDCDLDGDCSCEDVCSDCAGNGCPACASSGFDLAIDAPPE